MWSREEPWDMNPQGYSADYSDQDKADLEIINTLRKKIAAYIQNSFRTATLTELSENLKMSPTYVSRRVKELYGTSFTELLKERRFNEAEQLLLNGDLPVNAIAEAVGYENTSFFHRIFRQQYGISPSKWRKEKKS